MQRENMWVYIDECPQVFPVKNIFYSRGFMSFAGQNILTIKQ